jgi:hypothetical protein
MAIITLHLAPEIERTLREKATLLGQTLETYLQRLAEHDAAARDGTAAPIAASTESWSDQWRSWASSHVAHPAIADDSRQSIYTDRGE